LRSSPAGFTLHAAGTVTADATHSESEIFENVTEVADLGWLRRGRAALTTAWDRARLRHVECGYAGAACGKHAAAFGNPTEGVFSNGTVGPAAVVPSQNLAVGES
jgi:hypothetical protein